MNFQEKKITANINQIEVESLSIHRPVSALEVLLRTDMYTENKTVLRVYHIYAIFMKHLTSEAQTRAEIVKSDVSLHSLHT